MKLFSFFTFFHVRSYEILEFDSKPPGNQKRLIFRPEGNSCFIKRNNINLSIHHIPNIFQRVVIGRNGQIGVLVRSFLSNGRASFQPEREHANATIAINIALARI